LTHLMRPETPNRNHEMCDDCETPPAAFVTCATVSGLTPDQGAEIECAFKVIDGTRGILSSCIVQDDVPLVSMCLIETAHGCEMLSAWTGWRLPPAHQVLRAASIAVGRLFEPREVVVVVSGKPAPGMVEGDDVVGLLRRNEATKPDGQITMRKAAEMQTPPCEAGLGLSPFQIFGSRPGALRRPSERTLQVGGSANGNLDDLTPFLKAVVAGERWITVHPPGRDKGRIHPAKAALRPAAHLSVTADPALRAYFSVRQPLRSASEAE
jgi:hypothetical protein